MTPLIVIKIGCKELFQYLDTFKLRRGLFTRNNKTGVDHMLEQTGFSFDLLMARDFHPLKPGTIRHPWQSLGAPSLTDRRSQIEPDGAFHFAKTVGVDTSNCIFVGDSEDDMECGRRAGMVTIFLDDGHTTPPEAHIDFRVKSLTEIITLIRDGFHVDRYIIAEER